MAFGDVLWANLPPPDGHEQAGTRPAILVQADADDDLLTTRTIIPVTRNLHALRFPGTVRVEPSKSNGLSEPSVLLGFAITTLDKAKVGGKLGTLDRTSIVRLKRALQRFLQLEDID